MPDHVWAYDEWQFHHEPFINDLCLMLLVTIRHQVERNLVKLAARVTGHGNPLDREEYVKRVTEERMALKTTDKGWKSLVSKLKLKSLPEWASSMETLRLVANNYKHAPSERPDVDLLRHLHLDRRRNYASLPESNAVRERLAKSVRLRTNADYCDIAEEMLRRARFLKDVAGQPGLSRVKPGRLSLAFKHVEY